MSSNAAEKDEPVALLRRVGRIAGWSVALGIALELVQLLVLLAHDRMPAAIQVFADAGGKIAWSSGMCAALAAGLAAAHTRPRLAGLFGALAAPLAFILARAVHRGLSHALSAVPGPADPLSPWLVATLKAVEYGSFGLAIEWLTSRSNPRLRAYVAVGLVCGAAFAALIVALAANADSPRPALVSRGATELLFPVGCALVLYSAERAAAVVRRA